MHANDGINLTVPAGTIQGILGENGAGKSTLDEDPFRVHHAPTRGEILLDGKPCPVAIAGGRHPARASACCTRIRWISRRCGSSTTSCSARPGGSTRGAARRVQELHELAGSLRVLPRPGEPTSSSLTVGERQQLEITAPSVAGRACPDPRRADHRHQRGAEGEAVRDPAAACAEQGKTVIFVSHKLEEVEELCDRVAVLRQGKLVGEA